MRAVVGTMLALAVLVFGVAASHAETILGTGTASLLGGDLTDPEDDGDETAYNPPADLGGFDAEFFSSDEPGFGGGEFAFNVFDNSVGGGNTKWCCGTAFPQIVGAIFNRPFFLTHFTVTSGNDTDARRPRVWTIDGSNDGANWTTIFTQDDPNAPLWDAHNQVIRFDMDTDFPIQTTSYTQFRMSTTATGATDGAFFQVNEIEFFGEGEQVTPGDVNGDMVADLADYMIIRDNLFTGSVREEGDLNFSGLVDYADFRAWKDAFTAGGAVPEPGSCVLLLSGCVFWGLCGWRRNAR